MKTSFSLIMALVMSAIVAQGARLEKKRMVANPMALNYRFQPDEPSRREAADPTCVLFDGAYYLFASKAGGYWRSDDLAEWTYIKCSTIATIEDYAPAVFVYDGALYYLSSGGRSKLYRNETPEHDTWQEVDYHFEHHPADPYVFVDDDQRMYLYYGCNDIDPILGVEVDPDNGFRSKGTPQVLIPHRSKDYGWEVAGENNSGDKDGWNEGAAMLKHQGKYYLQYAAPGTKLRVYADGYYVADSPLGPFRYAEESPFSLKQGGFIGGAGHGDTFRDRYGNYWHVTTMRLSQRHGFERRLALFPVTLSAEYGMYAHTAFTDYPFPLPEKHTDFDKLMRSPKWSLLSYQKPMKASSELEGHQAEKAADEQVETWWSALTGNAGEWLQMDLQRVCSVAALQMNFADEGSTLHAPHHEVCYQYKVEASVDGERWTMMADQTGNRYDRVHQLLILPKPVKARYLRLTNTTKIEWAKFSVSGMRVFGKAKGKKPAMVSNLSVTRNPNDRRRFKLTWQAQPSATGYVVYWGTHSDKLTHQTVVMGQSSWEGGGFNRMSEYYFHVVAFNECGMGR